MLSGLSPGAGTSRIEEFSDGVFAFALTLLVIGFVAVFTVFALLHWCAYAFADALGLSPGDRSRALIGMRTHLLSVGVGVVSVGLVLILPMNMIGVAGFVYASLGPIHAVHGWRSNRSLPQSQP